MFAFQSSQDNSQKLPSDLILQIYLHLDPYSLNQLALVDKKSYPLARNEFIWEKKIALHFQDEDKPLLPHTSYTLFLDTYLFKYRKLKHAMKKAFTFVKESDVDQLDLMKKDIDVNRIFKLPIGKMTLLKQIMKYDSFSVQQFFFDLLYQARLEQYKETAYTMLDKSGFTLFHWATLLNQLDAFDLMLQKEKNIDIRNKYGSTPLHLAIMYQQAPMVEFLLNNRADPNALNDDYSPLCFASHRKSEKIVQMLLQHRANPNANISIYNAAQEGHTHIVRLLIESNARFDGPMYGQSSPLQVAAHFGHLEVVDLLCKQGANLEFVGMPCGDTPLYLACEHQHFDVVRLLIKHGANVNHVTKAYQTPLSIAVQSGCIEIVECLLEHGANSLGKLQGDNTLLHVACTFYNEMKRFNYSKTINALIKSGVCPTANYLRKKPADVSINEHLKASMMALERVAEHWNIQQISLNHHFEFDIYAIRECIKNYKNNGKNIVSATNDFQITISSTTNKKRTLRVETYELFLENAYDIFEQTVLLYLFLSTQKDDFLKRMIAQTMGFQSIEQAKNSLHSSMNEMIDHHPILMADLTELVIQPMLAGLDDNQLFSSPRFDAPRFCLTFLNAKVNAVLKNYDFNQTFMTAKRKHDTDDYSVNKKAKIR